MLIFSGINSAFCAELVSFEHNENGIFNNKTTQMPKALLDDEDYEIKGRIEFDEKGVMNLEDSLTDKMQINLTQPKKHGQKSFFDYKHSLVDIEKNRKYKHSSVNEYSVTPFFESDDYSVGKNFDYGSTFSTDMDMAQFEYRAKIYAKYKSKHLDLMTGFGRDIYTSSGREMESIYLVPEIKLGKGFALVDYFKVNPSYDRYRNDIILQYNPKFSKVKDRVLLEAAMGQINYYKSGQQYYQFSLSTKFKF